jgi:hypothetical protein
VTRPRRMFPCSLALLMGAVASSCVFPHFRHLEHVEEVRVFQAGTSTRDEVRKELGRPSLVDTPRLYVYDWEKAKTILVGYLGAATVGFTGTRALFEFDQSGHVARVESKGTGQGGDEDPSNAAKGLPQAAVAPPPFSDCGATRVYGAWFAGPEPRLIVRAPDGIRACDAGGSTLLASLPGKFYAFGFSPDGSRFATFSNSNALTLYDTATLAPLRELIPASHVGFSLLQLGRGISLSEGGTLVAAQLGTQGVLVLDTVTGAEILRLEGRWSPRLSPDGTQILSKAKSGFIVTEVRTGRDIVSRPLPEYPYGMSPDPALAHMLSVDLGSTAFSPDGRRLAIATCAHAEVWDLHTMMSSGWEDGLEAAFLLPFTRAFGVCSATVRFSPDGKSLAVANEGTVTLYDLTDRKTLSASALPSLATLASFAPDLSRAAFVTHKGLLLWEAEKS